MRRTLLLALLCAARTAAQPAQPVSFVRGDFIGTTFTSLAPCSNSLTCSPSSCVAVSNSACPVANQQGPTTNKTNTLMAAALATIQSTTCTVSSDARCTTAALTAVFGHFPGILAVYCNADYLVIHSSGLAAHPTSLASIFKPPGGGGSGGYSTQCVTRDYTSAYALYKIKLNPILLNTSSGTVNNAQFTFTAAQTASTTTVNSGDSANLLYNNGLTSMPAAGAVGVSVSGQNMYPMMNNNGGLAFPACETDMCNAHAGQGFDYHYHGDPFGPQCLYSCANYTTLTSHPPLIGYGLDGIPIFGRHLSDNAVGASIALDDCGGHTHTNIGDVYLTDGQYHYHAFVQNITSLNAVPYAYTAYVHGPFMCWKGNVNAIPNFWEGGANPISRTDYASGQIRPCSGNTNIYLAPGYSLNGVSGTGFNYSSLTYTVGAGNTGGVCGASSALSPPPSPPLPPLPPPPPPSPPPSPPVYIASSLTLGGYSVSTFGTAQATTFKSGVATAASASAANVTIVAVSTPSGRHLLQSSVSVSYSVAVSSARAAAATTALSSVTASTFVSAGMYACTGATVTAAPAQGNTAPTAMTAALPTTVAETSTSVNPSPPPPANVNRPPPPPAASGCYRMRAHALAVLAVAAAL